MTPNHRNDRKERELQLDFLLARYREACGEPEVDRNFMPSLWHKIESRQSKTLFFERVARTFVAGTMAACGFLGVLLMLPAEQPSVMSSASFVEDIADASAHETAPYLQPVHVDFNSETAQ